MKRWFSLTAVVLLAASGCRNTVEHPSVPGIEAYGLVESPVDHPRLPTSINMAETILGTGASVKLVAGWKPAQNSDIRVFAVAPEGFSDRELMSSYAECRCVDAKVGGVVPWLEKSMGNGNTLLDVDVANLVAYMLLHETGHIVHGDSLDNRKDSSGISSKRSSLNLEPTAEKDREIAADRFAADAIRTATTEKGTDRAIAASKVALTLSEFSFNFVEHRLLDNFGGTEVHAPGLFWDPGLSHPNLEWRILSVNDAISNSLRDYQGCLRCVRCEQCLKGFEDCTSSE
jgi:hypothetical protein